VVWLGVGRVVGPPGLAFSVAFDHEVFVSEFAVEHVGVAGVLDFVAVEVVHFRYLQFLRSAWAAALLLNSP